MRISAFLSLRGEISTQGATDNRDLELRLCVKEQYDIYFAVDGFGLTDFQTFSNSAFRFNTTWASGISIKCGSYLSGC